MRASSPLAGTRGGADSHLSAPLIRLPDCTARGWRVAWLLLPDHAPVTPVFLRTTLLALTTLMAGGCATVSGNATHPISIQTVDAEGRAIEGMSCRVNNESAQYVGDSPMFDLKVRRSSMPLVIECRGDGRPMARAVLVPRADAAVAAQILLPGGSSFMVIDHLTGFMYAYPRWVRLQAGADMVFDRRDERGREPTPGLVTRQFDDMVRFAGGASTLLD
jgi:hypothetical protein